MVERGVSKEENYLSEEKIILRDKRKFIFKRIILLTGGIVILVIILSLLIFSSVKISKEELREERMICPPCHYYLDGDCFPYVCCSWEDCSFKNPEIEYSCLNPGTLNATCEKK
jgi:hypothetical protein